MKTLCSNTLLAFLDIKYILNTLNSNPVIRRYNDNYNMHLKWIGKSNVKLCFCSDFTKGFFWFTVLKTLAMNNHITFLYDVIDSGLSI